MLRLFVLSMWIGLAGSIQAGEKQVSVQKTPGKGIQPQAVLDAKGSLHLLYFQGEAKGGNLIYVRRDAGKSAFSDALRVNSQEGSAIATGTIRGGHIAPGKTAGCMFPGTGHTKPSRRIQFPACR